MKAIIKSVEWVKEYDTKFGKLQLFKIGYDDKVAYYSSKSKDQTKFVKGKEAEFNEEEKSGSNGTYLTIKPITANRYSNFGKALKREQSKYSGFAMSYAKDLVVAGKIELNNMEAYTEAMFNLMVKLDKTLE